MMALDRLLPARWDGPPMLRFFEWDRPTVSLGVHQDPRNILRAESCRRLGVRVVRRPTGGAAVLHHLEITYSLVGRPQDFGASSLPEVYHTVARCLLEGLSRLGLPHAALALPRERAARIDGFCFQHTSHYEIAVNGKKLIGSAQRWENRRFLQHGSILLDFDLSLAEVFRPGLFRRDTFTTLTELVPGITGDRVVRAMCEGFARVLDRTLHPSPVPAEILREASRIRDRFEVNLAGLSEVNRE